MEQITISGGYAQSTAWVVFYVTERAIFRLMPEGLTLIEIALESICSAISWLGSSSPR